MKACTLTAVLLCVGLVPSRAGENRKILAHYETRLSERDHVNARGKRLTTAAAVLQRDREHIYDSNRGKRNEYQDLEDVPDPYFVTRERLESFEQALARGHIDAATSKAILDSTPMVDVTVYGDAGGSVTIDVNLSGAARLSWKTWTVRDDSSGAGPGDSTAVKNCRCHATIKGAARSGP